jgi:outer membrane lipoprotein LolB
MPIMSKRLPFSALLLLGLIVSLLSGCSTTPKQKQETEKPGNAQQAWEARQAKFERMKSWKLDGRVGLQHQQESWTFNISWLQRDGNNYAMNIKNPLTGSIVAYLQSTNQGVTLKASDGQTYQDADAENLLKAQMGVTLPLKGMKYWVRGMASPDYANNQLALDAYGRPASMQQAGWLIQYTKYPSQSTVALPSKMTLTHQTEKTKIKVIAKDWQTRY